MTNKIKKSLKERYKLTKCFYKYSQRKIDHDKVLKKSEECTKQILETKMNYILKMTKTLTDSNTSLKTPCSILNRLPYNKKLPTIPPFLGNGKQPFLITFLPPYAHLQIIQAVYLLFYIEQGAGSNPFMLLKMIY